MSNQPSTNRNDPRLTEPASARISYFNRLPAELRCEIMGMLDLPSLRNSVIAYDSLRWTLKFNYNAIMRSIIGCNPSVLDEISTIVEATGRYVCQSPPVPESLQPASPALDGRPAIRGSSELHVSDAERMIQVLRPRSLATLQRATGNEVFMDPSLRRLQQLIMLNGRFSRRG